MNKICLIRQPSGLGDIIFCLKIAYHYKDMGYEIWWPVISDFKFLNKYINGINFYDKGDSNYNTPLLPDDKFYHVYNQFNPIFSENFIYLPLQFADRHFPNLKIMSSKYSFSKLVFNDWVDYFNPIRDNEKENKLFYEVLGLNDCEKYVLVSRNYGSPPNFLTYPMTVDNDSKVVELTFLEGYTLFDWFKVLDKSLKIYTIDSSINFLIEKIDTEDKEMFLWSRRPNNWSEIDYFLTKKYKLMN
jgi:hypothetical protein